MSPPSKVDELIAAGKVWRYEHSQGAETQPGRSIYLAKTALPWVWNADQYEAGEELQPKGDAGAVQSVLDGLLREIKPDLCEGYDDKCGLKRLTGLSTAGLPELWEVRTSPPDAVRVFGFFLDRHTLLLTHGEWRDVIEREHSWEKQARKATRVKAAFCLGSADIYAGHPIWDYF